MAAPVVSGVVARMLQANPALTPNAVKAILQYTATVSPEVDLLSQGAGFLNTDAAVSLARFYATARDGDSLVIGAAGRGTSSGAIVASAAACCSRGDRPGAPTSSGAPAATTSSGAAAARRAIATTSSGVRRRTTSSGVRRRTTSSGARRRTTSSGVRRDNMQLGVIGEQHHLGHRTRPGCDNIIWGSGADNIIWGSDGDNIIWGPAATTSSGVRAVLDRCHGGAGALVRLWPLSWATYRELGNESTDGGRLRPSCCCETANLRSGSALLREVVGQRRRLMACSHVTRSRRDCAATEVGTNCGRASTRRVERPGPRHLLLVLSLVLATI